AGVERVRERKVDDPRLAAEIDRGLGADVGELLQPGAAPAGEHEGERVAAEAAGDPRLRHRFPPFDPSRAINLYRHELVKQDRAGRVTTAVATVMRPRIGA